MIGVREVFRVRSGNAAITFTLPMTPSFALAAALSVFLPCIAHGAEGASTTAPPVPRPDVKAHVLKNGMKFFVVENHSVPVFTGWVRFRVGSVDEHPGITGSTHLLEHMLFKGTRKTGTWNYEAEAPLMQKIDALAAQLREEQAKLQNPLQGGSEARVKELRGRIADVQKEQKQYIVKDELWDTYVRNGGSLNASTNENGTQYFVNLPANRLGLWMFLESDRLQGTVLREFYSERDVVFEERRLRTETQPQGKMAEMLQATAFIGHPYRWPVVGWPGDLFTVSREAVEAYYHQYYAPNNAIAAVVGDVKADEVFAQADKYFGGLPAGAATPPPVFSDEPEQEGERRVDVQFDAKPQVMMGWHAPGYTGEDTPALLVLDDVLSGGRTSRFKLNIEDKKVGINVSTSMDEGRYPGLFSAYGAPVEPRTAAELEAAIDAEIEKVKTEPVTDWELERTRNKLRADFLRRQESNLAVGATLTNAEAVAGDWKYAYDLVDKEIAVTAADVQRVAQKYLVKSNRTVATLIPTKSSKPKEPIRLKPGEIHEMRGSGL